MQGSVMSVIEATANIAVGYGVALAATAVVLPLFGFDVNVQQAISISLIFTFISFARSYLLRRLFNLLEQR